MPVDSGTLKKSGYTFKLENGIEIGYVTSYACFAYLKKQFILLSNGGKKCLAKLKPGDKIDNGFGKELEIIAIQKQPKNNYKIMEIETESGKKIIVTDNHRIAVGDNKFVEAKQLRVNDSILVSDKWRDDLLIQCKICGMKMKAISKTHLDSHNITQRSYVEKYGKLRLNKWHGQPSFLRGKTVDTCISLVRMVAKKTGKPLSDIAKQHMRKNHWSTKQEHAFNYQEELHNGKCKICGKPSDRRVFCSRECDIIWRQSRLGKNSPHYGKKRPEWVKKKMLGRKCGNIQGYGRGGFRKDLSHFVRSAWEANIARIFQNAKIAYEYEPKRFIFDTYTYLPDFYLIPYNTYVEVKGVDGGVHGDKKKMAEIIADMKKYYPEVKMWIIDGLVYKELELKYREVIPNWEWKKSKVLRK